MAEHQVHLAAGPFAGSTAAPPCTINGAADDCRSSVQTAPATLAKMLTHLGRNIWAAARCALASGAIGALPVGAKPVTSSTESTGVSTTEIEPVAHSVSVTAWRDVQIALARAGFSSGSIDGIAGAQTTKALRAFQRSRGTAETETFDRTMGAQLFLTDPPIGEIILTAEEFAEIEPLSATWLGKSQQRFLAFESPLEWASERGHAHPELIQQLNPNIDWGSVLPGTRIVVPAIARVKFPAKAARLHIQLSAHVLEARNAAGDVLAHFPVSIAAKIDKRPAGELRVTVVIPNPDYTFDPLTFPESAEGRELDRKLKLPPGPNNPVGLAWIGLDMPGYGIHGTPTPEKIGRTESHGCFRLANWDALTLIDLAWVGMPVIVEP